MNKQQGGRVKIGTPSFLLLCRDAPPRSSARRRVVPTVAPVLTHPRLPIRRRFFRTTAVGRPYGRAGFDTSSPSFMIEPKRRCERSPFAVQKEPYRAAKGVQTHDERSQNARRKEPFRNALIIKMLRACRGTSPRSFARRWVPVGTTHRGRSHVGGSSLRLRRFCHSWVLSCSSSSG